MPHHRGRLRFYPTFFDNIDLMVIAPHQRKTKTVKNPIQFECVPEKTQGVLSMLYLSIPMGIPDESGGRDSLKECENDMKEIAGAVRDMLRIYGFSAKKTSGFGVASENIEKANLSINLGGPEPSKVPIGDVKTLTAWREAIEKWTEERMKKVKEVKDGNE